MLMYSLSLRVCVHLCVVCTSEFGDRFRVVAMDLPGHGNSDDISSSLYTITDLARICREVLDAVNMQEGVIIGHDLGGEIAIEMSKTLPKLKILVLLDSVALQLPFSANANALTANAANPVLYTGALSSSQISTLYVACCLIILCVSTAAANLGPSLTHACYLRLCLFSASLQFAPNFRYPDWVEEAIGRTDVNFRPAISQSINAGSYSDQYVILHNTSFPVIMFAGLQDVCFPTSILLDSSYYRRQLACRYCCPTVTTTI
jgi:pimeloyl-ACP methyl ester carboxylesterase